MNTTLLMLTVCIPVRLILSYVAKKISPDFRKILAIALLIPAYNWLFSDFPTHGFFGGQAWWMSLRKVHALMYILFAISTFLDREWSYKFLFVDLLIGLGGLVFLKK